MCSSTVVSAWSCEVFWKRRQGPAITRLKDSHYCSLGESNDGSVKCIQKRDADVAMGPKRIVAAVHGGQRLDSIQKNDIAEPRRLLVMRLWDIIILLRRRLVDAVVEEAKARTIVPFLEDSHPNGPSLDGLPAVRFGAFRP